MHISRVTLTQNEHRRKEALEMIKNLSLQCSDLDSITTTFNSITRFIGVCQGNVTFLIRGL